MRKAVRVCKVGRFEAECACISVHLLQKVLHWLIRLHAPLHLTRISAKASLARSSSPACQGIRSGSGRTTRSSSSSYGRASPSFVLFVPCGHFEEILAKVFGEGDRSVISRRQHQPVEQVPNGEHIACAQFRRSSSDGRRSLRDLK